MSVPLSTAGIAAPPCERLPARHSVWSGAHTLQAGGGQMNQKGGANRQFPDDRRGGRARMRKICFQSCRRESPVPGPCGRRSGIDEVIRRTTGLRLCSSAADMDGTIKAAS